ncbi:unnamed protein product [Rangifer tarandus platyrhynchus]|uniref:Uncharacterized protein n=1 Tax=Rangifer tarandus platyrhynchus TaxID=3082113 RepID=A0AC59YE73_RANTA
MGIKGCLCVGEGPGPRSPLFQEPVVAGSGLGVPKSGLAGKSFQLRTGPPNNNNNIGPLWESPGRRQHKLLIQAQAHLDSALRIPLYIVLSPESPGVQQRCHQRLGQLLGMPVCTPFPALDCAAAETACDFHRIASMGPARFVTKPGPRSKPLICPSKRLRQIPPQYTDSRRDNVLERNKLESDPVRGTRPGHYQLVFHTVRWDLVMPRRWSVEKPLQVKQPEQQKHLTSETSPWWPVRDSQAI